MSAADLRESCAPPGDPPLPESEKATRPIVAVSKNTLRTDQQQLEFGGAGSQTRAASLPSVQITADGGCRPNPGTGGWGAVLRCGNACREISGFERHTTNNRAEWRAVIEALACLKRRCRVVVRSDSRIVVYALSGRGLKASRRKNQDLVVTALRLAAAHDLSAEWVRGHTGDPDNERADALASDAIRRGERQVA